MKYVSSLILLLALSLMSLPVLAQQDPGDNGEDDTSSDDDSDGDASDPSPDAEAFTIVPPTVDAGGEDVTVRFIANEEGLFSTSSAQTPTLEFGSDIVEVVAGSFKILSPNEAEARINVDEGAQGGVECRLNFYTVDGKSIDRQERATLAIGGPLETADVQIWAVTINLVQVNVDDTQELGSVRMSGPVNGTIDVTPPAGMVFLDDQLPSVTSNLADVSISGEILNGSTGIFSFIVANPTVKDVEITVGNLMVDTSAFGDMGAALGNQSSTIANPTNSTFTEQLLVNGYTALESLEGDDVPDPDDDDDDSQDSDSSDGDDDDDTSNSGSNISSPPSVSNRSGRRNNRRSNRNSGNNRNNSARPSSRGSSRPPSHTPSKSTGRPSNKVWRAPSTPAVKSGKPGSSSSSGGSPRDFADGDTVASRETPSGTNASDVPDLRLGDSKALKSSSKLFFADKSYKRLSSVVLDQLISDERRTRVWIVLERGADISPAQDTVTVSMRVGNVIRDVTLTETARDSAIFRSDKEGIEIAAPKD